MPMYNLSKSSVNSLKTSGRLWSYYRDGPDEADNAAITVFKSIKSKVKITGKIPDARNTKDIEIAVPLKYLGKFRRTLGVPILNCENNLILTSSANCVITDPTGAETFTITDTKLYLLVVTLSVNDNARLLQQLKSGFKRTIKWNNSQNKSNNRKKKLTFRLLN